MINTGGEHGKICPCAICEFKRRLERKEEIEELVAEYCVSLPPEKFNELFQQLIVKIL